MKFIKWNICDPVLENIDGSSRDFQVFPFIFEAFRCGGIPIFDAQPRYFSIVFFYTYCILFSKAFNKN